MKKAGYRGAGNLVRRIQLDPRKAGKYSILGKSRKKLINRVGSKAAFSMFVESNLSKSQYNTIKRYTGKVLPNYNVIVAEKEAVFPMGGN